MITLLSFALRLFSHLFGGGDGRTYLAGTPLSQGIFTTLKGNSLPTIGNIFYTMGDDFPRIFPFLSIWFQCRGHLNNVSVSLLNKLNSVIVGNVQYMNINLCPPLYNGITKTNY